MIVLFSLYALLFPVKQFCHSFLGKPKTAVFILHLNAYHLLIIKQFIKFHARKGNTFFLIYSFSTTISDLYCARDGFVHFPSGYGEDVRDFISKAARSASY
jgi:hypothetical protein